MHVDTNITRIYAAIHFLYFHRDIMEKLCYTEEKIRFLTTAYFGYIISVVWRDHALKIISEISHNYDKHPKERSSDIGNNHS